MGSAPHLPKILKRCVDAHGVLVVRVASAAAPPTAATMFDLPGAESDPEDDDDDDDEDDDEDGGGNTELSAKARARAATGELVTYCRRVLAAAVDSSATWDRRRVVGVLWARAVEPEVTVDLLRQRAAARTRIISPA